jgi:hypothetical protein
MRTGGGEDFAFDGEPWDVGRLRRALDGLPDEMPLVLVAEYEAGETETYSVVEGGLASLTVQPRLASDPDELVLLCRLREEDADGDAADDEEG